MASEATVRFGDLLRRYRLAAGYSQETLAERAGLSARGISDLERGVHRGPQYETLRLLVRALGLSDADRARLEAAARAEGFALTLRHAPDSPAAGAADVEAAAGAADVEAAAPALLERPRGTVTFLCTNLEGSTWLREAQPRAYREAVVRHHSLLRAAVEAHSGAAFETVGEAVYAVFAQATDAVAAALAGQLALRAEGGGEVGALGARMGLHTGEVERQESPGANYLGAALHRCARLAGAAHGGQVILSEITAGLVRHALAAGEPLGGGAPPAGSAGLLDLGAHRLEDLPQPERVFQLLHPGLPAAFPPLLSLDAPPTNLPVQLTLFIGQERLLADVRERLLRPEVRLLTLSGPGGTGKTRLALQAASDLLNASEVFPDGVWLVPLAAVRDPALVPSALAEALGVKEAGGQPLLDTIGQFLRPKRLLFVLDNFEQVLPAAAPVARLLARAAGLKLLVTSRTVLRVSGEHGVAVPPLALPPPPDPRRPESAAGVRQYDAVRLFVERARAARADFALTDENAAAVAEVCRRLDGLPLALELAAARVRLLSPVALLARLEHRLPLLTAGPRDLPARQQTLRATLAWSHDLLGPAEQVLFRRLGVFVGGCTLDAAALGAPAAEPAGAPEVPDVLDGLSALVDSSLLEHDETAGGRTGGESRVRMLETVREYALERLEASGEAEAVGLRHATYYLTLAEAADPEITGPQQGVWLLRLEHEHGNLQAALRWLIDRGRSELALRLGGALWRFWFVHGHAVEGRRWLEEILVLPAGAPSPPDAGRSLARAHVLLGLGALAWQQRDHATGRPALEEAAARFRSDAERRGLAYASTLLGLVARDMGDVSVARDRLGEGVALFRELADAWGLSVALTALAATLITLGDVTAARAPLEEGLDHARRLGHQWLLAISRHHFGRWARQRGDLDGARSHLEESLALFRRLGDTYFVARSLAELADVARDAGEPDRAAGLYDESLALYRDLGDEPAAAAVQASLDRLRADGSVSAQEPAAASAAESDPSPA